ncbi:MAG: YeeE/YedE family protein [Marinobacter sp.]|nr:YeeE/YedE family protein [Marinobacter sp.]
MIWPLYDSGVASGLLAGFLFGFVLENAGFGSPRKLTGQFRLEDWSVFKVMFTAVIVAALLLWLSKLFGLMGDASYYVPTPFYLAMAVGGLLIGAGFAIGGYCPGTSVAGFAGGRIDAVVFMIGMVIGTALFAAWFGPLEQLYLATPGPQGQTLMDLTGIPEWLIIIVLAAMAWGGFKLGSKVEQKLGGPYQASDLYPEDTKKN